MRQISSRNPLSLLTSIPVTFSYLPLHKFGSISSGSYWFYPFGCSVLIFLSVDTSISLHLSSCLDSTFAEPHLRASGVTIYSHCSCWPPSQNLPSPSEIRHSSTIPLQEAFGNTRPNLTELDFDTTCVYIPLFIYPPCRCFPGGYSTSQQLL